jgi:hypothetical protein
MASVIVHELFWLQLMPLVVTSTCAPTFIDASDKGAPAHHEEYEWMMNFSSFSSLITTSTTSPDHPPHENEC